MATADADRRAMLAEAAQERHPAWCNADPLGCSGFHAGKATDLTATDKDGELPLHVVATYEDATGARAVEILFEFEAGPVSISMTEAQANALASAVTGAAGLLAGPWTTWSWGIEQVEAYARALSGRTDGAWIDDAGRTVQPAPEGAGWISETCWLAVKSDPTNAAERVVDAGHTVTTLPKYADDDSVECDRLILVDGKQIGGTYVGTDGTSPACGKWISYGPAGYSIGWTTRAEAEAVQLAAWLDGPSTAEPAGGTP
jgi:hypothetical protein